MSDAARLTLLQLSQFPQMLRKGIEENGLFIKAKFILTLGAVLLAGGAALVFTGAVIFFLLVPAVILLSPVFLVLSVLSMLYHKVTHQQSRSVSIYEQNSVVVEVGVWSVMSGQYRAGLLECLG